MKTPATITIAIPLARVAIPTLAEIKAAVEAFDRGAVNAFDALDAIVAAVESYHAAVEACHAPRERREAA